MADKKPQIPKFSLLRSIIKLFSKLRQNPDIYPIRYYKKNRRFRRHWHGPLVK